MVLFLEFVCSMELAYRVSTTRFLYEPTTRENTTVLVQVQVALFEIGKHTARDHSEGLVELKREIDQGLSCLNFCCLFVGSFLLIGLLEVAVFSLLFCIASLLGIENQKESVQ